MKKKQKKAKASHKKRSFLKIVGYIILFFFGLSVFMTLCYRWINPPVTPLMLIRAIKDGESIRKDWVPIEDISYYMISAAIASEDNNFLGHKGFDFGAIQKAVDLNKKGKRKRGASTISQQTAKNVFLWPGRSWIRKGLEVYFTFLIETFWPKDRIMEVYLNVIEMGPGIYGSEAAAQHYFHIPATKLTKRQASLITACYTNPREGNPAKRTSYNNQRAYQIAASIPKFGKIKFDKESIQKAKERYKKREEKRIKKNDGKVLAL